MRTWVPRQAGVGQAADHLLAEARLRRGAQREAARLPARRRAHTGERRQAPRACSAIVMQSDLQTTGRIGTTLPSSYMYLRGRSCR